MKDRTLIPVSKDTRARLITFKYRLGLASMDEVIRFLMDRYEVEADARKGA
jgi:hypothetical protein